MLNSIYNKFHYSRFSAVCVFSIILSSVYTNNAVGSVSYVDLGLPSGTLWATSNTGTLLAHISTNVEQFYAWGEINGELDEKLYYLQDNYKYAEVPAEGYWADMYLTKYNASDGLITLESLDDVANFYSDGVMPTALQMKELITECEWQLNQSSGCYTIKGPNGRSMELPAAGYKYDNQVYEQGTSAYYWTRSLKHDPESGWSSLSTGEYGQAVCLHLSPTFPNEQNLTACFDFVGTSLNRFYGMQVRAVATTYASRTKVTSITINGATTTHDLDEKGYSLQLTATCSPANASSHKVWWRTSDSKIAEVDLNGKITFKKQGTVTITAWAKDAGGAKKSVTITAYQSGEIGGSGIRDTRAPYGCSSKYSTCMMLYTADEIVVDKNIQAIAFQVVDPSALETSDVKIYMGYTKENYLYSSLSSYSLTQVYSGRPTLGAYEGWEKIILQKPFSYSVSRGNLVIVVCRSSTTWSNANYYLGRAGYDQLYYRNGSSTNYSDINDKSTSFQSYSYRPNIKLITSTQTPVSSISISGCSSTLQAGTIVNLLATITPNNANPNVTWSSSDRNIASINTTSGLLEAKEAGTVTITCRAGDGCNVVATKQITVTGEAKVTSISVSGTTSLKVGETAQWSATISPYYAADRTVTWSSSDNNVATVSSTGLVTAIGTGNATIYAMANDGSGIKGLRTVTVTNPVTSISISPSTLKMDLGQTYTLSVTYTPSNAENRSVGWSSSDEAVATVSSSGVVTAVGYGSTYITAYTSNNKYAYVAVDVLEPGVIGNGTESSSNLPYSNGYKYSTCQMIYTSSEIGKNGVINSISFNVATKAYYASNIDIYLGYKATETFGSNQDYVSSGLTKVYSGSKTLGSATGWEKITLTTPFQYNQANGNLIVVVCHSGSSSTNILKYYFTGKDRSSLYRRNDSTSSYADYTNTSASYSLSYIRPNIKLDIEDVKVQSISITGTSSIYVGSTTQLTATCSPSNAGDKSVTWSSSNTSVATVSSTGLVTGKSAGTTTITATANDGSGVKGTLTLTVKNVPVSSISVTGTSSIYVGSTTQLTATCSPSNAYNKTVTWSSSNTSVATVSSTGLVTGKSAGTATITATANDGSGVKGTLMVTVKNVPVSSISITGSSSVEVGTTTQLTATCSPSNAYNKTVTWSSSNTSVATVSSTGVVTGISAGTVTITATANDGSGVKGTKSITVNKATITIGTGTTGYEMPFRSSEDEAVTEMIYKKSEINRSGLIRSIAFSVNYAKSLSTTLNIFMGYKSEDYFTNDPLTDYQLINVYSHYTSVGSSTGWETFTLDKPFYYDMTKGNLVVAISVDQDCQDYTYLQFNCTTTSGNTVIITDDSSSISNIDTSWWLSAARPNIQIVMDGISTTATSVSVSGSSDVNVGQSIDLTSTISPSDASVKYTNWKSSNTSIAKVNAEGKVTGVAPGSATITATTADGSNKSATKAVTVSVMKGDVNGSGNVTSADVTGALNFVLEKDVTGLYQSAADYNSNGVINTTDVVSIVRVSLIGTTAISAKRRASARDARQSILDVADITITSGETATMGINFANKEDHYVSFQFDLELPDGLHVEDVLTSDKAVDHSIAFQELEDGTTRIMCYSMSNSLFNNNSGNALCVVLRADENAETDAIIALRNIELVHSDVSTIFREVQTIRVKTDESTGIDKAMLCGSLKIMVQEHKLILFAQDDTNVTIYNMMGDLIYHDKLIVGQSKTVNVPEGVYFVNDQKVMVK